MAIDAHRRVTRVVCVCVCVGTHAHSFVTSFVSEEDLPDATLRHKATGETEDLLKLALRCREELGFTDTNTGELTAFTAYAR